MATMNRLLDVVDLQKSFGGLKALDGINLSVSENSITAVIGPNGSGKTTFLNCINGIYIPERGRITFRGKSLVRMFKKISVMENILAPVLRSKKSNQELRDEALVLLERVGMTELKDNLGEELSGGQQKLLELLRAWIADSDLILLDEPFAGVHPELKDLFYREIREMQNRVRSGANHCPGLRGRD
jgi:branched-chain amino acid transport system ATP-binding protein